MIYSSVDRELLLLVFLLCLIHKPGIRCAGCSTNIEYKSLSFSENSKSKSCWQQYDNLSCSVCSFQA